MARHRLSRQARRDLFEILKFGYERFGIAQGDAYAEDLRKVFDLIADTPRIGRRAERLGPTIRRHEHGPHVILYEETSYGVHVVAVVHSSRLSRLGG